MIPTPVKLRVLLTLNEEKLHPCSRAVLFALREVAGRRNAVSIEQLQNRWARNLFDKVWTDREVKAAVKELLEVYGVPIGSARTSPCGYFLCTTPEDIDAAEKPIVAEVRSLARRLRAINPKSEISRALCGQLEL